MTNNTGESLAWKVISLLSLHQVIVWKECLCVCVCVYVLEPCPKASAFSASPGALAVGGHSEVMLFSFSLSNSQSNVSFVVLAR